MKLLSIQEFFSDYHNLYGKVSRIVLLMVSTKKVFRIIKTSYIISCLYCQSVRLFKAVGWLFQAIIIFT